jgi:outer membrane receptor protein involved in Fe transport
MKKSLGIVSTCWLASLVVLTCRVSADDSSGASSYKVVVASPESASQTPLPEVKKAITVLQRPYWYPAGARASSSSEQPSTVQAAAHWSEDDEDSAIGDATDAPEKAPTFKSLSDNQVFRMVSSMFLQSQQPMVRPAPTTEGTEEGTIAASTTAMLKDVTESKITQAASGPLATGDIGNVLTQSSTVQSVEVQHRSPVSADPYIRGYKGAQIYTQADGVYWTPARRDMDTMLSKIDPDMMRDVVVMPGPYGLRYGPGFAFIDVSRELTPRPQDGFESHYETAGSVRSNGGQVYGRETISGGNCDWGFRGSYGERSGSDYSAGGGLKIPSSYHNQDSWGQLSFDINQYRRIDFAYQRLDQSNVEIPCEVFNIDYLGAYGFETRVVDTNPMAPWTQAKIEGWYNHTFFHGPTSGTNSAFPVIDRVNWALTEYYSAPTTLTGWTEGNVSSGGARMAATFGDPDDTHVNVGADFRYVDQVIGEYFDIWGGTSTHFSTSMPHSWMRNPGVYVEWGKPLTDAWTAAVGARGDYVTTTARESEGTNSLAGKNLTQDDTLYAFYCKNDYKLNDHWTVSGNFGFAQRPPTLIERYANGLFISSLQSGFTHMIGDPDLNPERAWQMDVGVSADHERWRGKAAWFYSWVLDYVTYYDDRVVDPDFPDARLLRYMNTPLASLTGFELYGEYDWLPRVSAFGKMSYVQGRDETLDAWLPGISPLEGTAGLRFHNPEKEQRWNIDVGARMVTTQDKLGVIRMAGASTTVEERTPGFTTCYIRGVWNCSKHLRLYGGVDNLFDTNYQEHLDLRLSGPYGPQPFPDGTTRVLAPGISPFAGLSLVY